MKFFRWPLLLTWAVAFSGDGGLTVLAAHPVRVQNKNIAVNFQTDKILHDINANVLLTPEPTEEIFVTAVPTPERVARPSYMPSIAPSAIPTTAAPTFQPSDQPSEEPTSAPTDRPSSEPSEVPSPSPTVEPTEHPTVSMRPTTSRPTQPTGQPTGQPTHSTALVGTFNGIISVVGLPEGCCDIPECVAKWELTLTASSNSLSTDNIDVTECSTGDAPATRRLAVSNLTTLVGFAVQLSQPYDSTVNMTVYSQTVNSIRAAMISFLGSTNFTSTLTTELLAISFIDSSTVLVAGSSDLSPVTVEVTFTRAPTAQPTSLSAGSGSSASISQAGIISIAVVIPGFFCIVVMTAVYFLCCGGGSKGDGSSGGSKEWIEMPQSPHQDEGYVYGLEEEEVVVVCKDTGSAVEALSIKKAENSDDVEL
jgi:hypothetical protein